MQILRRKILIFSSINYIYIKNQIGLFNEQYPNHQA